jgi:hypothetical protein
MSAPSATINQPNFSINNNTRAYSSYVSYPTPQTIQPTSLKGSQGPQGEEGDCGDDGPQGPQGDVGPRGFLGAMGMQGYQGVVGPQGPAGDSNGTSSGKSIISHYNTDNIDLTDVETNLVSVKGNFISPYITASVVVQSTSVDVILEFNLLRNGERVVPYSYYYTVKKLGGYKTINLQFHDFSQQSSLNTEYTLTAKGKSDSSVKVSTSTIFVL